MRVIHYMIGVRLHYGGVVRCVIDMCEAMARRGHDVTLLTTDATDVPPHWDGAAGRPRCEVVERTRFKLLSRRSAVRTREILRVADVVHLHGPWDPTCWQIGRIARRMRRPYFVTTHGMLDDWSMAQRGLKKRLYLSLFGRSLLEHAAAVHCTASAERDQAEKWYPRGRSEVIPCLFDVDTYSELPGPELAKSAYPEAFNGVPSVMFLSRLHAKKNPEALIHAAKLLQKTDARCRVMIAGSGEASYDQSLRDLVDREGLADQVKFLGFVSGELKASLYQAADLFVLPTMQENFGFALVEAMACGTPVITTKGVDIWPELVRSGGVAISRQDPQSLADTIGTLLRDEGARKRMASRGRNWVHRQLDPQRVARKYENMYENAARAAEGSQEGAVQLEPQGAGAF